MVVQHNLTAMNANRYLGINNSKLSKSLEKLSSGYKINRAGDDAAGLAVSEKMRSQIAGMQQGVKNAQAGISMVQTFEGALTETDSILQRMKVLADQMSNGSYDNEVDRAAANLEFKQLNDELNQIADTDYNGVVVLNGGRMADNKHNAPNTSTIANVGETAASSSATDITYGDKTYTVSLNDKLDTVTGFNFLGTNLTGSATGLTYKTVAGDKFTNKGVTWTTDAAATITGVADGTASGNVTATGVIDLKDENFTMDTMTGGALTKDTAIKMSLTVGNETYYSDAGAKWYDKNGAQVAEDAETLGNMLFADTGLTLGATAYSATGGSNGGKALTIEKSTFAVATFAKSSGGPDADVSISDAYGNGRRNLTYADSITLQVGARSKDAVEFTFKYSSDGIGNLTADLDCSARGLGTDQLTIATQEDANYAIDQIDNAINKVSMVRGTFGAIQNRLEHKIDNLNVSVENLTDAESKIRDTNMAEEMMSFTKNQILAQASQSMLAQANQLPQSVLSLLQ